MIGMVLFGFGIAVMVRADLGLVPWDVLHQGIARNTPLTIGVAGIITSLFVVGLWFPLGEKIRAGTVVNAISIGLVVDLSLLVLPEFTATWARWVGVTVGVLLISLATSIYIGADLGPGPRDGLMTGLARKGWSIRGARILIEIVVLAIGWAMGGTVGIGTLMFAFGVGPLVQATLPWFETTDQTYTGTEPAVQPAR